MQSALFVSPDLRFNGGDKSLYTLLASLEQTSLDLLIPAWCHRGSRKRALDHLRQQRIEHVSELKFGLLPRQYCYLGAPEGRVEALKCLVKRGMWNCFKPYFYKSLLRKKYDFIHLNSITLYPLICPDFPFIVHVREVVDHLKPEMIRALSQARGIIFIDQTTKKAFQHIELPDSVVLNNPFDMAHVETIQSNTILSKYSIPKESVVFSIIGSITPFKGVDRIIEAFKKVGHPDIRLLIAGAPGSRQYADRCKKLADGDERIAFVGLMENVDELYAISDYIVRGDPLFGVGRSTMEGLYSGCGVVMPGTPCDLEGNRALEAFSGKVFLYSPGCGKELTDWIAQLAECKVLDRKFFGNSKQYVKEFQSFVNGVL